LYFGVCVCICEIYTNTSNHQILCVCIYFLIYKHSEYWCWKITKLGLGSSEKNLIDVFSSHACIAHSIAITRGILKSMWEKYFKKMWNIWFLCGYSETKKDYYYWCLHFFFLNGFATMKMCLKFQSILFEISISNQG
jgi:hypothetical protein